MFSLLKSLLWWVDTVRTFLMDQQHSYLCLFAAGQLLTHDFESCIQLATEMLKQTQTAILVCRYCGFIMQKYSNQYGEVFKNLQGYFISQVKLWNICRQNFFKYGSVKLLHCRLKWSLTYEVANKTVLVSNCGESHWFLKQIQKKIMQRRLQWIIKWVL